MARCAWRWIVAGIALVATVQLFLIRLATEPPSDDNVDDGGVAPGDHRHHEQRPLYAAAKRSNPAEGTHAVRRHRDDELLGLAGGGGAALAAAALLDRARKQAAVAPSSPPPTASAPPRVLPCTPRHPDATSALAKAKTDECRAQIARVACAGESGTLYPDLRPNPLPSCRGRPLAASGDELLAGPPNPALESDAPLRIAFLIACHGRSVRQVKRLLRMLYDPRHIFLIHVDSRSDHMQRRLSAVAGAIGANVRLTTWRMATIWGGLNLYQMYLRALRELLDHEWDYFINLSGADLPIAPLGALTAFLLRHRAHGVSFLKTHSDEARFVRRQGLNRTFVLCDNHMFRTGPRDFPPSGVRVEGASDWYLMHRQLAQHVTTGADAFVRNLTRWFDHTLLGAESFFHTAAANGPLCNTVIGKNYRLANWNRARGCKCQYKAVVDWCGCSPNVILADDRDKLQRSAASGVFFARKFDGKISNSVIDFVEASMAKAPPLRVRGFYWESVFDADDAEEPSPGPMTYFASFARQALRHLKGACAGADAIAPSANARLLEVHLVMKDDAFLGYAVRVRSSAGPGDHVVFEALFTSDDTREFAHAGGAKGAEPVRVGTLGVGVGYDGKERVFNRRGGMVTTADKPVLAGPWPGLQHQRFDVEWRGQRVTVPSLVKQGAGREMELISYELPQRLDPGEWVVAIRPSAGVDGAPPRRSEFTIRFPVATLHPVIQPANVANDKLISSFWTLVGVCLQDLAALKCRDTLGESEGKPCRLTPWSSLREGGDVTVEDILEARH